MHDETFYVTCHGEISPDVSYSIAGKFDKLSNHPLFFIILSRYMILFLFKSTKLLTLM